MGEYLDTLNNNFGGRTQLLKLDPVRRSEHQDFGTES